MYSSNPHITAESESAGDDDNDNESHPRRSVPFPSSSALMTTSNNNNNANAKQSNGNASSGKRYAKRTHTHTLTNNNTNTNTNNNNNNLTNYTHPTPSSPSSHTPRYPYPATSMSQQAIVSSNSSLDGKRGYVNKHLHHHHHNHGTDIVTGNSNNTKTNAKTNTNTNTNGGYANDHDITEYTPLQVSRNEKKLGVTFLANNDKDRDSNKMTTKMKMKMKNPALHLHAYGNGSGSGSGSYPTSYTMQPSSLKYNDFGGVGDLGGGPFVRIIDNNNGDDNNNNRNRIDGDGVKGGGGGNGTSMSTLLSMSKSMSKSKSMNKSMNKSNHKSTPPPPPTQSQSQSPYTSPPRSRVFNVDSLSSTASASAYVSKSPLRDKYNKPEPPDPDPHHNLNHNHSKYILPLAEPEQHHQHHMYTFEAIPLKLQPSSTLRQYVNVNVKPVQIKRPVRVGDMKGLRRQFYELRSVYECIHECIPIEEIENQNERILAIINDVIANIKLNERLAHECMDEFQRMFEGSNVYKRRWSSLGVLEEFGRDFVRNLSSVSNTSSNDVKVKDKGSIDTDTDTVVEVENACVKQKLLKKHAELTSTLSQLTTQLTSSIQTNETYTRKLDLLNITLKLNQHNSSLSLRTLSRHAKLHAITTTETFLFKRSRSKIRGRAYTFTLLKLAVTRNKAIRTIRLHFEKHTCGRWGRLCWYAWKRYHYLYTLNLTLADGGVNRRRELKGRVFECWSLYGLVSASVERMFRRNVCRRYLVLWKGYVHGVVEERRYDTTLTEFNNARSKRGGFTKLKKYVLSCRIKPTRATMIDGLADGFVRKRWFGVWYYAVNGFHLSLLTYSIPKLTTLKAKIKHSLLTQTFHHFHLYTRSVHRSNANLLKSHFKKLFEYNGCRTDKMRMYAKAGLHFHRTSLRLGLQNFTLHVRFTRYARRVDIRTLKWVFHCWKGNARNVGRIRRNNVCAVTHYFKVLTVKTFRLLRTTHSTLIAKHHNNQTMKKNVKKCLDRWRTFLTITKLNRDRAIHITALHEICTNRDILNVLKRWYNETRRRKKVKVNARVIRENRIREIKEIAFGKLITTYVRGIRDKSLLRRNNVNGIKTLVSTARCELAGVRGELLNATKRNDDVIQALDVVSERTQNLRYKLGNDREQTRLVMSEIEGCKITLQSTNDEIERLTNESVRYAKVEERRKREGASDERKETLKFMKEGKEVEALTLENKKVNENVRRLNGVVDGIGVKIKEVSLDEEELGDKHEGVMSKLRNEKEEVSVLEGDEVRETSRIRGECEGFGLRIVKLSQGQGQGQGQEHSQGPESAQQQQQQQQQHHQRTHQIMIKKQATLNTRRQQLSEITHRVNEAKVIIDEKDKVIEGMKEWIVRFDEVVEKREVEGDGVGGGGGGGGGVVTPDKIEGGVRDGKNGKRNVAFSSSYETRTGTETVVKHNYANANANANANMNMNTNTNRAETNKRNQINLKSKHTEARYNADIARRKVELERMEAEFSAASREFLGGLNGDYSYGGGEKINEVSLDVDEDERNDCGGGDGVDENVYGVDAIASASTSAAAAGVGSSSINPSTSTSTSNPTKPKSKDIELEHSYVKYSYSPPVQSSPTSSAFNKEQSTKRTQISKRKGLEESIEAVTKRLSCRLDGGGSKGGLWK